MSACSTSFCLNTRGYNLTMPKIENIAGIFHWNWILKCIKKIRYLARVPRCFTHQTIQGLPMQIWIIDVEIEWENLTWICLGMGLYTNVSKDHKNFGHFTTTRFMVSFSFSCCSDHLVHVVFHIKCIVESILSPPPLPQKMYFLKKIYLFNSGKISAKICLEKYQWSIWALCKLKKF